MTPAGSRKAPVARARALARRALRKVRGPAGPRPAIAPKPVPSPAEPVLDGPAWDADITVALYVSANMNNIDGSSVWTSATAHMLHADPRLGVVMPLRTRDRRPILTGSLSALPRVALIDSAPFRAGHFLLTDEAVEMVRALDERKGFDIVMIRGFDLCLQAVRSGAFTGRLWSIYALEPERDTADPEHLSSLKEIVDGSRYVATQTSGMRRMLEQLVPSAAGKHVLIPPTVPPPPAGFPPPARRLFYAGKFAPQYAFPTLVEIFSDLRERYEGLTFEVAGDKILRSEEEFAAEVERLLEETPALTWHGAISREDVFSLLARGGVALNVWEGSYARTMNDLVMPSKTLDYCLAGVPVITQRTSAQEELLGESYPLFVSAPAETGPLVQKLFEDEAFYRDVARHCRASVAPFVYDQAVRALLPAIDETVAGADR